MDNNGIKVVEIHLEDIIPNPFQPRLSFNEDSLSDLAESIKLHGIIQPLVLRKNGEKYEIIAGERRFKAATLAGLATVPAIITEMNNEESAEVALVENLQRKNLTPIEEARSYEKLQQRGYSQEKIAKQMGVSQSAIANKIRLLNLDEKVQQALLGEKISERHARSLLNVNKEQQIILLERIINERLTVRQLDTEIAKINGGTSSLLTPIKENHEETAQTNNSFANIDTLLKNQESMVNDMNEKKNDNIESLEIFELPSQSSEVPETFTLPTVDTFKPVIENNNESKNELEEVVDPTKKTEDLSFPIPIFNEKKEEEPPVIIDESKIIISKEDFSTVIRSFDKLKADIEDAGLQISMETFNFDEYYQLIIKVFK